MKDISRFTKLLFPLLTILVLLLSACQSAPSAPAEATQAPEEPAEPIQAAPEKTTEPEKPAGEKVKLAYYSGLGAEVGQCLDENILAPFEAENPDIDIEWTQSPENWDQVLRTELAGGGGPDFVTQLGPTTMVDLAKAGYLEPLDEYSKEYGWDKNFAPWALNLGVIDGKLYMLPTEVETLVLYYNKTLFEKNGWTPPKTIDELVSLAETIDAAGIIPFAHGGKIEWRGVNEWYVGEAFNHVAGPQAVFDALSGKKKWTDPEFVKAIQLTADMQKNGWFMGGVDRYMTATFTDSRTMFGMGEAAMNIEGTWFITEANNFFGETGGNENDWDWVPMPSNSGEAIYDLAIGNTFAINVNSQHKEEAARFLNYFFSSKTQSKYFDACGVALGPVPADEAELTHVDPRWTAILADLEKASSAGSYGYTTWTFFPPATQEHIIAEIEKVWTGTMTPEEFLEAMQEKFDKELEDGLVPPLPARQ